MVVFTEVMAKLVSELADKTLVKVTVSEDSVVFDFTGRGETASPVKKKEKAPHKNARIFTFNGKSHTAREWADLYKVPYKTMYTRLHRTGNPENQFRRGKEPRRVKKG